MNACTPGFQANDLDASAAIDLERADRLQKEAAALIKRAAEKRAKAGKLRNIGVAG